MRAALVLACLPLAAEAGADPDALYRTLITGTWAETAAACTGDETWTFYEGGLNIHGDGGETCVFDQPGTDGGNDVVLDLLCPIPVEDMQVSARRIGLDLERVSPGLSNPEDILKVTDKDNSITLSRCP